MAQNEISINFTPCEPAPIGYRVKYRPLGSEIPFRTWPVLFTSSPIQFVDENDPELTDYEGTLESVCVGDLLSVPVPWTAYNSESASIPPDESESGSEVVPCEATVQWDFTEDFANGSFQIWVNGVLIVTTASTSSGSIQVQAGDTVKAQVNGSTGTLRQLVISGCISEVESSNTTSVSHEWTAVCDCVYEVTGNVSS